LHFYIFDGKNFKTKLKKNLT